VISKQAQVHISFKQRPLEEEFKPQRTDSSSVKHCQEHDVAATSTA